MFIRFRARRNRIITTPHVPQLETVKSGGKTLNDYDDDDGTSAATGSCSAAAEVGPELAWGGQRAGSGQSNISGDHEVIVFTDPDVRRLVRDETEAIGRQALPAAWQVDPNK